LDSTGVADACADVFMVSSSIFPTSVIDQAKMRWIVLKDFYPLTHGYRHNLARWVSRILRFLQRMYPTPNDVIEAVKMCVHPIPRKEVEADTSSFQGWPQCFIPMMSMGVECYNPDHNPNRPGQRKAVAKGLVPNFNTRNLLGAQIASRLPHDEEDLYEEQETTMKEVPLQRSSLPFPEIRGYLAPSVVPTAPMSASVSTPLTPVYKPMVPSLNPAPGVVQAPIPPFISLDELRKRSYSQDNSIVNSFYFVCWRILECKREGGLRTVDLYKDMRKGLGVDQVAGRVLDDLIKMGWFRKEPAGISDHVVVMNFAWQYV